MSLFEQALIDDVDKLAQMIAEGADINSKNEEGKSAFTAAFEKGLFLNADLLAKHNADFTNDEIVVGGLSQPLLHHASVFGLKNVIEKLLERGTDINIYNHYLMTPLGLACVTGLCPKEVIEYMIEKGADVNTNGVEGDSLLLSCIKLKKSDLAALLVEKGADIDSRDNAGNTPFEMALGEDDIVTLKAMLEKHPDRKQTVIDILILRLKCLIDFMKNMKDAAEDDERWQAVPEVAQGIEETKVEILELGGDIPEEYQ